jgi:hypothetical protein
MVAKAAIATTASGWKAMDTVRSPKQPSRDRLGAFVALTSLALLAACEGPRVAQAAEDQPTISSERIGDICAKELSYDVTGPYYASCRNYLTRHAQAQPAVASMAEPPEHRACEQIGLAKDTLDYRKCVQELSQLDVSAAHL